MTVGVIATLKAQEGKEAEFEAAMGELGRAVRANEPGNKLYTLFKSRKDAGSYIVLEIYDSEDALKAHSKSDHYRSVGRKVGATLAAAPDIHYLDAV